MLHSLHLVCWGKSVTVLELCSFLEFLSSVVELFCNEQITCFGDADINVTELD